MADLQFLTVRDVAGPAWEPFLSPSVLDALTSGTFGQRCLELIDAADVLFGSVASTRPDFESAIRRTVAQECHAIAFGLAPADARRDALHGAIAGAEAMQRHVEAANRAAPPLLSLLLLPLIERAAVARRDLTTVFAAFVESSR